jgi:hypothetical protein
LNNHTIISGLIGALLSGALGFWIRWFLDRRSLLTAERRLAYVHLVSVTAVVAADALARTYLKLLVGDKASEKFSDPAGAFEPSHAVSALIHQELVKLTPSRIGEIGGTSLLPHFLKGLVETARESQLGAEQLSRLPKDAVLVYSQYGSTLSSVRGCLELWAKLFETGDTQWLTVQFVHDNWLAVDRFCKQAKLLRQTLVAQGACTKEEAQTLMKQQIKLLTDTVFANWTHKPKLEAAVQSLQQSTLGAKAG